jgi:hypothetical protein
MLEGDSPEVITKTGNTTIKKMKTHKKNPGRQNRKRPAEAAGSLTQVEVFKLDQHLNPCKLCAETA